MHLKNLKHSGKWALFLLIAATFAFAADQKPNNESKPAQSAPQRTNARPAVPQNGAHNNAQPAMRRGVQNGTAGNNNRYGNSQNGMHNGNNPAAMHGTQPNNMHPNGQAGMRPGMQNGPHNTNQPMMHGNVPRGNGRVEAGHPNMRVQQTHEVHLRNGGTATFGRTGRVREFHANGMDVRRGIRGDREVVHVYPNGRRLVAVGPHAGFYERPYYRHGGYSYVQRTYVYGGHRYAYAYRTTYWGGHPYYRYAPAYYYRPGYYGWAYRPWGAPVYYSWGWRPVVNPWYGYYGYYFAPAPVYPTASLWLTDYLLAVNLQMAYEAQQQGAANAAASTGDDSDSGPSEGAVQLTPQVKQAIANEVQQQLAEEQQDASAGAANATANNNQPPAALDPNVRVFVVASNLDVADANGQECELTAGDVISRIDDQADGDNKVRVSILSSKKGDCSTQVQPGVDVSDLQEMNNHFHEQVDAGLKQLASNQGKNGLPSAPDTTTTTGEVPSPQPDADADGQIQQEQNNADQSEAQAQQEAGSSGNSQNGNNQN